MAVSNSPVGYDLDSSNSDSIADIIKNTPISHLGWEKKSGSSILFSASHAPAKKRPLKDFLPAHLKDKTDEEIARAIAEDESGEILEFAKKMREEQRGKVEGNILSSISRHFENVNVRYHPRERQYVICDENDVVLATVTDVGARESRTF